MTEKLCFVIAPIGDPESETRKRSDKILKYVIAPAVGSCGYKAIRADQIAEPGMITSQVIQHIVDDPLVVADLTGRNANVFYELAIRHILRKPFVQLIKKGEQIPFDVAGARTIHVDHSDLDIVEEAKKEIVAQVQSLERDSSALETPISVSLDLQTLKQSENPERRSLADLLSVISEMRSSIAGLEKRLDSPEAILPLPYLQHVLARMRPEREISRRLIMELDMMLHEVTALSKDMSSPARELLAERLERVQANMRRLLHEID